MNCLAVPMLLLLDHSWGGVRVGTTLLFLWSYYRVITGDWLWALLQHHYWSNSVLANVLQAVAKSVFFVYSSSMQVGSAMNFTDC